MKRSAKVAKTGWICERPGLGIAKLYQTDGTERGSVAESEIINEFGHLRTDGRAVLLIRRLFQGSAQPG